MNEVLFKRTQGCYPNIEIDNNMPDNRVHFVRNGKIVASIQDDDAIAIPPRKRDGKTWFQSLNSVAH